MNKLYATEEREGGTRAVGGDVPGVERKQLGVFTPTEEETVNTDFVLETWQSGRGRQVTARWDSGEPLSGAGVSRRRLRKATLPSGHEFAVFAVDAQIYFSGGYVARR